MPSPDTITGYRSPGGIRVRVDSGVHYNYEISTFYDSMISKLIVWGADRHEAIMRMRHALCEYIVIGPKTNIPYLRAVMENKDFYDRAINTRFVQEHPYLFDDARILYDKFQKKLDHFSAED